MRNAVGIIAILLLSLSSGLDAALGIWKLLFCLFDWIGMVKIISSFLTNLMTLPADYGPCYFYNKRFYCDAKTWTCEPFIYGGCGGNSKDLIHFWIVYLYVVSNSFPTNNKNNKISELLSIKTLKNELPDSFLYIF